MRPSAFPGLRLAEAVSYTHLALAAQRSNIPSVICMPDGAPISKVEATKAYGAQVCLVKGAYDDAYDYACKLQKEKGYTFIHPFNDAEVIAGQGTVGLEILDVYKRQAPLGISCHTSMPIVSQW